MKSYWRMFCAEVVSVLMVWMPVAPPSIHITADSSRQSGSLAQTKPLSVGPTYRSSLHAGLSHGENHSFKLGTPDMPGAGFLRRAFRSSPQLQAVQSTTGQAITLLPDGSELLTGGELKGVPTATISVIDPQSHATKVLAAKLTYARAYHTATVLPDGTVFVFGGIGEDGKAVTTAEIYDPAAQRTSTVSTPGLSVRAHQSATLLTDGQVLLAGGISATSDFLASFELWNPATATAQAVPQLMLESRRDHSASLLPNGSVLLWGGVSPSGAPIQDGEVFDPVSGAQNLETNPSALQSQLPVPFLEASIPSNDATNVPVNTLISFRFSKPLAVPSLNAQTISLSSANGTLGAKIVPAEGGMLGFLNPLLPLEQNTTYTVTLGGASDAAGHQLPETQIVFTTVNNSETGVVTGFGATPQGGAGSTNPAALPPLKAPAGVTALAGQVLLVSGAPLEHVLLQIDGHRAFTDQSGRFLLQNVAPGHHEMVIDGQTADRGGRNYGIFLDGVDIQAGQTNVLNYAIWLTRINVEHSIHIPPRTTSEVVITSPLIPGLELHIPPGTVIRDLNGHVVTSLSITPIPINKPPFPLPAGVQTPVYFTIQPGGAYLDIQPGSWTKGAQLYYPNPNHAAPGTLFDFWNYDPNQKGWYIYGEGHVSKDGKSIVPDPGVEIYQFTGAMLGTPSAAPGSGPTDGATGGDPVDLSTGLFVYKKTDLVLSDTIPLALTRTYRPADSQSRPFGIGTTDSYEMFLVGNVFPYTYTELILPDGSRIHFDRVTTGTDYGSAVYMHFSTPTRWYGATLYYDNQVLPGVNWVLTTRDGTSYYFPDGFGQSNPGNMALLYIRNRQGDLVSIARDSNGNVTEVSSPNGKYLQFQSDSSNRITQASDSAGRTVQYSYDSGGRLASVTDANGGVTSFTYDSYNNMLTVEDARGITYLTNEYDSYGRVSKQTLADGSTYQFAWTAGQATSYTWNATGEQSAGSNNSPSAILSFRSCSTCTAGYAAFISQVDVTDPRGTVRRVQFSPTGHKTTEIFALGNPEQQTYTFTYYADNLLNSVTDALGRTTNYTYDANGNVTQITRLAGSSSPVTTSLTYEPFFNQLATVTDPLSHTTSISYDQYGNPSTVTDALGHQATFSYNADGQVTSATDSLGHATAIGYTAGNPVTITDPLGNVTTRVFDNAGRMISAADPLGQRVQLQYDSLDQITQATGPTGSTTSFAYDANGNLLSVTDAAGHTTNYTYDSMDRLAARKDALNRTEVYSYDGDGNLTQFTDRRGKVSTYTYDGLNRRLFAGFARNGSSYESTIGYTYDAGNRLTQAVDSATGTISRSYDQLNRVSSETTPQGSISYTWDALGRRTSATVAGQTEIDYSYDNANRLTQITQGTSTVSFGYDTANRRTSLTLPNGIVMSYSYDNDSRLTGISYQLGGTTLENLTYAYDAAGRRISMGGTAAAINLPQPAGTTAYNANNQLTQSGTTSLYYDANGNMTSDGTNSYVWNGRNQLASMNSGGASFQYDLFGRRASKTILSTTTNYLYDGANIVQELSGTSPIANLLSGGLDEVFTRTDSSGTANFLSSVLGSTLALTDSSGGTLAQYTYDPFGNTTTSGSSTNAYQYTGRENDGTGLYFYRARYYSPTFQRFISEDPAQFAGGDINLYAYVGNSPANLRDASGMGFGTPCRSSGRGKGGSSSGFGLTLGCAVAIALHYLWNNATNGCGTSIQNYCAGGIPPGPVGLGAALADDAAAYEAYWEGLADRAPVQSSPYDVIPKYGAEGNMTGATTYDEFGNRAYQYEWDEDALHGPGYHWYDNSGTAGYGNGPRSGHIPF